MPDRPFTTRLFDTLAEAILNGYHVHDHTPEATLLRKRTRSGQWLQAIVLKDGLAIKDGMRDTL
jgi:hypothetical protein